MKIILRVYTLRKVKILLIANFSIELNGTDLIKKFQSFDWIQINLIHNSKLLHNFSYKRH